MSSASIGSNSPVTSGAREKKLSVAAVASTATTRPPTPSIMSAIAASDSQYAGHNMLAGR
jgi:hypothetical protein